MKDLIGGMAYIHESKQEKETSMSQLMEEILSRENMMLAYKKVKANKGAPAG